MDSSETTILERPISSETLKPHFGESHPSNMRIKNFRHVGYIRQIPSYGMDFWSSEERFRSEKIIPEEPPEECEGKQWLCAEFSFLCVGFMKYIVGCLKNWNFLNALHPNPPVDQNSCGYNTFIRLAPTICR